jgi:hypothetical protein
VVCFNHLSRLKLDCTPAGWSLLLSHLVYPPLIEMRFASTDVSTFKLDILAGLSFIAQALGQQLIKHPIRCIVVSRFNGGSVMLQTWTKRGTWSGPPLEIRFYNSRYPFKDSAHGSKRRQTVNQNLWQLSLGWLEALLLERVLVEADPLLETSGKLKSLDTTRFVRPGLRGHAVIKALSA